MRQQEAFRVALAVTLAQRSTDSASSPGFVYELISWWEHFVTTATLQTHPFCKRPGGLAVRSVTAVKSQIPPD